MLNHLAFEVSRGHAKLHAFAKQLMGGAHCMVSLFTNL